MYAVLQIITRDKVIETKEQLDYNNQDIVNKKGASNRKILGLVACIFASLIYNNWFSNNKSHTTNMENSYTEYNLNNIASGPADSNTPIKPKINMEETLLFNDIPYGINYTKVDNGKLDFIKKQIGSIMKHEFKETVKQKTLEKCLDYMCDGQNNTKIPQYNMTVAYACSANSRISKCLVDLYYYDNLSSWLERMNKYISTSVSISNNNFATYFNDNDFISQFIAKWIYMWITDIYKQNEDIQSQHLILLSLCCVLYRNDYSLLKKYDEKQVVFYPNHICRHIFDWVRYLFFLSGKDLEQEQSLSYTAMIFENKQAVESYRENLCDRFREDCQQYQKDIKGLWTTESKQNKYNGICDQFIAMNNDNIRENVPKIYDFTVTEVLECYIQGINILNAITNNYDQFKKDMETDNTLRKNKDYFESYMKNKSDIQELKKILCTNTIQKQAPHNAKKKEKEKELKDLQENQEFKKYEKNFEKSQYDKKIKELKDKKNDESLKSTYQIKIEILEEYAKNHNSQINKTLQDYKEILECIKDCEEQIDKLEQHDNKMASLKQYMEAKYVKEKTSITQLQYRPEDMFYYGNNKHPMGYISDKPINSLIMFVNGNHWESYFIYKDQIYKQSYGKVTKDTFSKPIGKLQSNGDDYNRIDNISYKGEY